MRYGVTKDNNTDYIIGNSDIMTMGSCSNYIDRIDIPLTRNSTFSSLKLSNKHPMYGV